jgi:DNA-binding GntR family transcriptional regulator
LTSKQDAENTMPTKKISLKLRKPVSIREKIYKNIREDIISGVIPAGERLFEARIAREINASRTPVREALHMLEMEGFLETVPRVGYRVSSITLKEVEELCEIRIINETLAAQWAIDRITPRQIRSLEEELDRAETSLNEGNTDVFVNDDARFHEGLSRASGSNHLFELCQLLRRHMLRYRMETLNEKETVIRAIAGHRDILGCIRARDKDAVAHAMRDHLEWVKRDITSKVFNR